MDGLEHVILSRRSIRKYKDLPITIESILHILELSTYAPTASNIQPWIFGIIDDQNTIKMIEAFSPGMPRSSAIIIAVCSDQQLANSKGGNKNLCTLDCAFAGQNLILAAYERGIGSCIVCSFNRLGVSSLLELPKHIYLEYLITLGYPDQNPKAPKRKPVRSVLFANKWSDKY